MEFDNIDRKLLIALQVDASRTVQDLAAEVGLSTNACWRRIKNFEEQGVITARVALVDPDKVGHGVTVFVSIRTADHSIKWLDQFAEAVRDLAEIVELYRMAGDIDYLMKLRVATIAHYDQVYKQLIARVDLVDVSASFAMEEIKHTTAIPLLPAA